MYDIYSKSMIPFFGTPSGFIQYSSSIIYYTRIGNGEIDDYISLSDILYISNNNIDDSLLTYYFIELLKMIQILFQVNFIHSSLSLTNIYIKSTKTSQTNKEWTSKIDDEHWSKNGLVFTDFNRCIDLSLYPTDTFFHSTLQRESHLGSFREHIDVMSVCNIMYQLICGCELPKIKNVNISKTNWKR